MDHPGHAQHAADTARLAGAWITCLAGVLIAVSGFQPWITARLGLVRETRNAYHLGAQHSLSLDGIFLLVLGLLTLLVGIMRLARPALPELLQRSSIVTGVVAVLVVVNRLPYLGSLVDGVRASSPDTASIGFGAWVAVAGGIVAVAGGLLVRPGPRPADRDAAGDEVPAGTPRP